MMIVLIVDGKGKRLRCGGRFLAQPNALLKVKGEDTVRSDLTSFGLYGCVQMHSIEWWCWIFWFLALLLNLFPLCILMQSQLTSSLYSPGLLSFVASLICQLARKEGPLFLHYYISFLYVGPQLYEGNCLKVSYILFVLQNIYIQFNANVIRYKSEFSNCIQCGGNQDSNIKLIITLYRFQRKWHQCRCNRLRRRWCSRIGFNRF